MWLSGVWKCCFEIVSDSFAAGDCIPCHTGRAVTAKHGTLPSYRASCGVCVIHPAVSFPALVVSVISQWMVDFGCVVTKWVKDPCFEATLKNLLTKIWMESCLEAALSLISLFRALELYLFFTNAEGNSLVLKHTLRLSLSQQASGPGTALLLVILFSRILASFKR